MVTRGKGAYFRRKESTEGGLQALMPGQCNYFTSRAFDSFFPVLKSQFSVNCYYSRSMTTFQTPDYPTSLKQHYFQTI